jgi:hypothetical protein
MSNPSIPTAVSPQLRKSWHWLPLLVAASLLVSAGAGAAVAWIRLKKQPISPEPPVAVADSSAVDALFSKQRHEQFLKDAVDLYADPGSDQTKIRNGLNHCVELGLLYLDQWRLEEADVLFTRLAPSPVEQYATFGMLGHAIVLGLQNKTTESNQAFMELIRDNRYLKNQSQRARLIFENPQLAHWTARALDYNFANAAKDFPNDLTPLRTPIVGGARRGASDKSSGKK